MDRSQMLKVLCPVEKDGKTFWLKLGVGFANRDGVSHNLYLDALPTNGRLQLRPFDEPDRTAAQPKLATNGDIPF